MAPNILHSKSKDPVKDENFLMIEAVHMMLESDDDIWIVESDLVADLERQQNMAAPVEVD